MSRFVVVGSFLGVSGLINRNRAFYVHTSPYISTHMGWFSGWPGIRLGYRPDIVLVDLYSPWVDLVHPVSACFIRLLDYFGPGCWIVITTGMDGLLDCWIVGFVMILEWKSWIWFLKKKKKQKKESTQWFLCFVFWFRFDWDLIEIWLWDELLFITEMIDC